MKSIVYYEDCKVTMNRFSDKHFDLAIVDPIYGIDGDSHRKNKNRSRLSKSKDYHNAIWYQKKTGSDYFSELLRVSKNQIIFGANYFASVSGTEFPTPRRNEYDQFLKDHPYNWIIWDKVNSTTGFNDCELIHVSYPIKSRVFYYMWNGFMQGLSFKDGIKMNPDKKKNQKRIHPTEKPFEIYKYLLTEFSKHHFKILDTHLGSGSHRLVCWDLNLDFTAAEINSKYYNDQELRFRIHKSQLKIEF